MPLVVGFHGAGGVGAQMVDVLRPACESHGVAILAPESRGATWDIIRGAYGPDIAFIDRALRSTFDQAPIDPGRIAAAGFSDGASYALSVGIANGPLFSDILAFSPGFMAPPAQAGRPRVFISHGVGDEVLPIAACSRRIVPRLQAAGYDVTYEEFDGGHVVPPDMVEKGLARFLK
jgi:phospholipase/carboxylesterase